MSSAPKFSIITTCKGRLDHLKQTLPDMVRQESAEVIVVDFSCPQGAASYVESTFPAVRVVKVENKDYYAHCEARNAGAAVARGEWLLFCDADIDLAATCTQWLSKALRPDDFGRFAKWHELKHHKPTGGGLGVNNLEGFQVLERRHFERFRGYDIRLRGYGAGGDMELCQRAVVFGLRIVQLDESIVKAVISHGDDLRQTHAKESWLTSYLRGFYYSRLKLAFTKLRDRSPSSDLCDRFIESADEATRELLAKHGSVDITFPVDRQVSSLTRTAGIGDATVETILTVRISLKKD